MSDTDKAPPREFWFDLETTSDSEPVVNCIHFERPEYEADYHVIEHSAFLAERERAERAESDDKKTQAALEHVRGLLDEKSEELSALQALAAAVESK